MADNRPKNQPEAKPLPVPPKPPEQLPSQPTPVYLVSQPCPATPPPKNKILIPLLIALIVMVGIFTYLLIKEILWP